MEEWFTLARIARPRGVRGEVIADGSLDDPERFLRFSRLHIFPPGEPIQAESAWVHGGRLVLKFRGIDSMSDAEKLRDAELRIPKQDRPPLDDGEYYYEDFVGCRMVRKDGGEIGEVSDWIDAGAGPILLEVKRPSGSPLLVPFVPAICLQVDLAGRRIVAQLPEGLEELES